MFSGFQITNIFRFSRYNFDGFCAGVLFTSRQFSELVLGWNAHHHHPAKASSLLSTLYRCTIQVLRGEEANEVEVSFASISIRRKHKESWDVKRMHISHFKGLEDWRCFSLVSITQFSEYLYICIVLDVNNPQFWGVGGVCQRRVRIKTDANAYRFSNIKQVFKYKTGFQI